MEDLEDLVDDMLDDIDEHDSNEELPTRCQDSEYLRELGILIDEYEE